VTEYEYDEKFPYVVVWGEYGAARFSVSDNAKSYAKETAGKVIDTTPKPKIPEDAQYILWYDDHYPYVAVQSVSGGHWYHLEDVWTLEQLLSDCVGDAEVTVLVPKED
jgi:hypothetical protein